MFSLILRKEILTHIVSSRFVLLLVLCVLLVPLSYYVNLNDYNARQEAGRAMQESYRQVRDQAVSEKLDLPDPGGFRDHSPLAIIARGYDDVLPEYFQTSREGLRMETAEVHEEPTVLLFGRFDLLFILKTVFSFLALLFTYEAIAGEKERGTLKLMLSNSVPRDQVLLGKLVGGFTILFVPFLLSALVGGVFLLVSGYPLLDGDIPLRFAAFLGAAFLYLMVFYNLGLLVSARVHSALSSFTVLLFLWVILVLVVPPVAGIVSKLVYPMKSFELLNEEKQSLRNSFQHEKATVLSQAVNEAGLFQEHAPLSDEGEWNQYTEIRRDVAERYDQKLREALARLDDDYKQRLLQRDALSRIISRISPASSFTFLATSLCGTGMDQRDDFLDQAGRYQNLIADQYYNKTWKDVLVVGGRVWNLGGSSGERKAKENLPPFSYNLTMNVLSAANIIDALTLFLFSVLLFGGAYVSFIRYDVR